ncbi:MAG: transketolase [Phycisphaerales bacterium]|jgi:transketolase|nr:transketolase [Phycisphaerales bacterium]
MSFEAAVHAKAIDLDLLSLDMTAAAGSGHPTSALSLGHLVTVLMYHHMKWLPDDPRNPSSDRLVLSEGHAVPIVYAACADIGVAIGKPGETLRPMTRKDCLSLRADDSMIDGHPNPVEGFPFFDAATGSLGQGLSVAAGLALAARLDEIDKRIFCIVGDGESREGQIWEAADFIADHDLASVIPIFNCNGLGQADQVSDLQSSGVITRKLEAVGFTVQVVDGHDPKRILEALETAREKSGRKERVAIVAKTVKGWGAPCIQGGGWHGKPAVGSKLQQVRAEFGETRARLTTALKTSDAFKLNPPTPFVEIPREAGVPMPLSAAMKEYDMASTLATGRFATRKAFGLALRMIGHANAAVHVLDADVKNSTFTEWFANDRELSKRFSECKIAEQNMASVAVGLSAAGRIPFLATFSKFLTRAYDQIEMGINSGANLKIVGSHSGISLAADGPSQMSLPDVAWFRSFSTVRNHRGDPGCYVLQPADAHAAYSLTQAMARYDGPCYMRVFRPEVEFLYDDDTAFDLGGFEVLNEGRDLMIASAGYMIHECNKAIEHLDRQGIDATLVDLYSLPFDEDGVLDVANSNGGNILVVEDNYGGGIGSAIADACTSGGDAFTVRQMHVRRIPKSARTTDEVLRQCGLDAQSIAVEAAKMVGVTV